MRNRFTTLLCLLLAAPLAAQVPNLIPHQGRVAVNGVNFDGAGQFRFALVNAAGTVTYWSNDGTGTAGSQPAAAVSLPVTKGLYSVMLGDASLGNMTAVPASVYNNADLRLRVWFNDGALGFQQLTPDHRLAPNGYLPDGVITSAKLAPGASPPAVQVAGTSQNVAPNTNYIATNSGTATFLLPATATVGDVVNISSPGSGGTTVVNPDAWTPRSLSRRWTSVASSADGTKLIAAAASIGVFDRLYTSTDSGATWTAREQSHAWNSVASSADGTKLIAATYDGQLFTSTDSGATWTPREQRRLWFDVASSADGTRLTAGVQQGQLYISTDSGITWTPREQNRHWTAVASSADGTRLIAAERNGQLYTSSDAGATWTPREQSRQWYDVASSADGTKLIAAASSGQLYTSTDSGITWMPREQVRAWRGVASSADGTKLVAATLLGRLYMSADSGVTWTPREQNRRWWAVASSADGGKLIAAVADGKLYTYPGTQILTGSEQAAFTYGNEGWTHMTPAGSWTPAGADVFRPSGNVGIGTGTPNYPLSFGNSGTLAPTQVALYESAPGLVSGIGHNGGQFRLHLSGGSLERFSFLNAPDGNEIMTILGDGRVGIGAQNPSSALHVNGVITGDGSGLTGLNAANLTGSVPAASLTTLPAASLTGSIPAAALTSVPAASLAGTINAAALPATVALRNAANTFTGNQSITGNLSANGSVNFGPSSSAAGFAGVAMGNGASAAGNYSYAFGQGAATTAAAGNSVALGSNATAAHSGSFLWSDATGIPRSTTAQNQFAIHAAGGVTVNSSGNFNQPQLLLTQTTAGEWSRLRMQSNGPAWDIALGPGASPVMNFYNGTSTVLALGQDGDATLQRNLNGRG